jgi:hypothetical protein
MILLYQGICSLAMLLLISVSEFYAEAKELLAIVRTTCKAYLIGHHRSGTSVTKQASASKDHIGE